MRLCTICDKKIEGTWCKNCRRFVKTYEISNSIYLNERHDPLNDRGCTYHTDHRTDSTKSVVRERTSTSTGTQRTYTQTTSASTSGTSRSAQKKKGKKTVLIIIIIYILVNSLGFLGPAIKRVFDKVSDGFRYGISSGEVYDEESVLPEEEGEALLERKVRDAMLQGLIPAYHIEEESYEILYYKPEVIRGIGHSCDSAHFAMTFDEFEAWLAEAWTDSYQYVDDISMYSNYHYITDDYSQVQFSCYRDYYVSDDFAIRIEYDTATELVHAVGAVALEDSMDMDFCYALLQVLEPDTTWTKDLFINDVEDAKEIGDYATLYYSEEVHVAFEMNEEGYSLVYYPIY